MPRLFALALGLLLVPVLWGDESDPEPPSVDNILRTLDRDATSDKVDEEQFAKRLKEAVIRLEKIQADYVKRGKKDEAQAVKEYIMLASSVKRGAGLETKLTVRKLMEKASAGRYRELLHVVYVPQDRAGYTDYRDYGLSATNTYGGQANLTTGYWVYVYPRWYIWKEIKPGK